MSESQGKLDLKSLVSQIVTAAPTPAAPTGAAEPAPVTPVEAPLVDQELQALFEAYFDLEEAAARDVVFEKIVALKAPAVTEFLRAVLEHDEDEMARAGAAAELAHRHDAAGMAALEEALADRDDTELFTHALQVLADVLGPAFYERAKGFWQDDDCDAELKHEALLAMESTDTTRALADFTTFIAGLHDLNALPDDQLEVMMLAFVRHGYRDAVPVLEALKTRLTQGIADADERDELTAFVGEGIALLQDAH